MPDDGAVHFNPNNSALPWRAEEIYRRCLQTILALLESKNGGLYDILDTIQKMAEVAISMGENAPTHATRVIAIRRSLITLPAFTEGWRDTMESLMVAIEGLEFELTGCVSEVCSECGGKGAIEGIGDRSVTCKHCDGKKIVFVSQ